MGRDLRHRFRRWRVRTALRVCARSRTGRFLFLATTFPVVYVVGRIRGDHPPASWRVGMRWVRTGLDPDAVKVKHTGMQTPLHDDLLLPLHRAVGTVGEYLNSGQVPPPAAIDDLYQAGAAVLWADAGARLVREVPSCG